MSTLSGIAAKGEKGKSKFQSLDINNLYKASRGESLETHQHKNTSSRRHGMQSLGKIPSARRAPANLPSLKSEYSGNDPAVSLVPSGGTGWGSKPGETGPPPTASQAPTSTTPTPPSVTSTAPATVSVTVTTATFTAPPPAPIVVAPPPPVPTQSHSDKSWSSITSSGTENTPMFLAHQSPYFQQEFPSLSGDPNATPGSGPNKADTPHLPGPSLRPQTEGSWMQGGSRPQGQMGAGVGNQQGTVPAPGPPPLSHLPQGLDVGGGRSNLGPSGVAAGPAGPLPTAPLPAHHYRLMPQFMIRHNHPPGVFPPNYQHGPPRPRFPYPPDTRFMPPNRGPSNMEQEMTSRPIIKEEDLKVMDDARDSGWAGHDEIDYNQTLSFGDEEGVKDEGSKARNLCHSLHIVEKRDTDSSSKCSEKEPESIDSVEKINRENSRESLVSSQNDNRETQRAWQQPRPADFRQGVPSAMVNFPPQPPRIPNHQSGRQGEDEEVWRERRRIQNEEIAVAVERAKQRKEEEEKRYEETRQAAARKLQKLEEKMRSKTGIDKDETSASPPLNVQQGSNALLPDWEKDKEKNRSRTNSEDKDEKPPSKEHSDNFRNVQMDNNRGVFGRDRERDRDRELRPEREGMGQPFSRQFQNNLPPRFQKQAAERPSSYYKQNSGGSPQPPPNGQPPSGQPPHDVRWPISQMGTHFGGSVGNVKSHRNHNDEMSERDRDDGKENRDRDRNINESGFDSHERERFNRPPSRDSREKSHESNWKSSGNHEETSYSRINSDNEHSHEYDIKQFDKFQESEDYIKEKDKEYRCYEDGRETDKSSNESFKPIHSIQEDPFDERNKIRDIKVETERRDLSQKPERPQRPDSRDSRASRDSRNSREDKLIEETIANEASLSWADSTYEVEHKEDKRRRDMRDDRRDMHPLSYHQRHIPGPITKEKLEASELKCESARNMNLVPLVRNDKKPELKKSENQWEVGGSSGDAWQRVSASPAPAVATSTDCWTASSEAAVSGQGEPPESQQPKVDSEEAKNETKISNQEREDVETNHRQEMQREKNVGRGGNRGMRHDSRGPRQGGWGGGSFYRGGPPPWRGGGLGESRGKRAHPRKPNMGREWPHSESESADEVSVSNESGKEDKRQDQDRKHFPRSPKQGVKRSEKEERMRDMNRRVEGDKDGYPIGGDNRRYEKRGIYDGNRMTSGFEPRGEPSRRGRGAPFRSKGSAANVGRRMDGYGPPTSKRPFTSESTTNVHEDKKIGGSNQNQSVNKESILEMSHDDKMKINQQQLSAGIIGHPQGSRLGNFKSLPLHIPPRLRRKSEGERRDRKSRDSSGRGPRGSIKSGSGSGGEVGDENWETTSDTSEQEERDREDERQNDSSRRNFSNNMGSNRGHPRRLSQTNREKRNGGSYDRDRDHNSRRSMGGSSLVNGNVRTQSNKSVAPAKDQQDAKAAEKQPRPDNKDKRNNLDRIDLCNTASVVVIDDQPEVTVEEDQRVFATDNNGFQEVRSKKNVKEANRQQKEEPSQKGLKERAKPSKPPSSQSPGPPVGSHLLPASKGLYERPRTGKLAPRFARLRENTRLQKMAQQQQTHDISEQNKINHGPVFPIKDLTSPAPPPPVNAWDKPITAALRTSTPPATTNTVVTDSCNIEVNDHVQSATSSQRSSPNEDKSVNKLPREPTEKAVLDGTSPPVQTIIFENTNYKSAPVDVAIKSKYTNQIKNQRPEKPRERKLEEDNVALGFKSPGPDMKLQDSKTDPIQMPMSFTKNEDNADMKLDFRFDSDLSQLTDDKTSKSMTAIQMAAQSSTADLQFKLASVKKVWENPPAVLEHGTEDNSTVSTATSFTPTFGNSVEETGAYGKAGVDPSVSDDGTTLTSDSVYNSTQPLQNTANTYNGSNVPNMIKPDPSSNVCKVKPQPQATMHPHPGPLSPPSGAFNSSAAHHSQHINYQIRDTKLEPKAWIQIRDTDSQKTGFNQSVVYTYLSNCEDSWHKVQPPGADPQQFQQCRPNITPPTQYGGISAIPSPPTVFTPQAEIYPTFQINNPQVMGSQGRSQFSQFASPYLSQGLGQTSGFSQQSVYLHQTAQPPPSAAPDMFQTQLSQYRIQPPGYGTSQQLSNNPNTVLISSSTNSLMSASVKPSPQPIGAIGSKGASYQATSQPPPSQLYLYPDPQMLSQSPYLQRPASNVVPTMPPSSASYYSASTGGATGFYQPGSSSLQAAAAQGLHQTTFGMQAFNTQSQAATPAGMGSFGSTMAQQYRSTAPSYLKSAPDHQDVLSVFSSPASQINSPKSHANSSGSGGGGKPGGANGSSQQQSSPTQSHKFSTYQQNVSPTAQLMMQQQQQQQRGSVSVRGPPRLPTPIQRPVKPNQTFSRHRMPTRFKLPPPTTASVTATATTATHYYVTQNNSPKLETTDMETKVEEGSSESENSSSNANKSLDNAVDDSTSAND